MTNNWAILVGINTYDFLPNAPLQFARQDALAMQLFLCKEAQFAADKVMLCGDGSNGSKTATRPLLRQILLKKLQRAQDADNLWFFFSGHGMVGADRQDYLMTSDSNPDDLEDTAVSINFVTDSLRACNAKNIVLVLDMCRNEGREVGRKSDRSMETSLRELVKHREGQQGIITLFSCGRGESSYEIPNLGQGAFTHALLNGLRQHTILEDLEKYLAYKVPELHESAGKVRKQVPLVISEPCWKCKEPILSHHATAGDVVRLKDLALDSEHDRDIDKAIRLWKQVNLLAIDPADRSRAMNQLLALTSQLSPPVATNPPATLSQSLLTEPRSGLSVIEFTSVKVDLNGNITHKPQGKAEIFIEDLGNEVSLSMVRIPAGKFLMGSPMNEIGRSEIESPQHQVRVPEFYMGQTLVTQAQWQQVMGDNPSQFNGDDRLPVEKVSWLDTQEFLQKLSQQTQRNYRLPSEAEWEYACRARSTTPFSFGETISSEIANYCAQDRKFGNESYMGNYGDGNLGEFRNKTTHVDDFPPNAFGLYDMHGNLYEWCLDHWHFNYENAPSDGSAWLSDDDNSARVRRGGSWNYDPCNCRSANRHCNKPSVNYTNCGFRVTCELPGI